MKKFQEEFEKYERQEVEAKKAEEQGEKILSAKERQEKKVTVR